MILENKFLKMKLKNKKYEIIKLGIYAIIVAALCILSVILIPINEIKLIAVFIFVPVIIFLIKEILEKQKLINVSIRNYEKKSDDDIKMELIDDQYAMRYAVSSPYNDESEEEYNFKMIEDDLELPEEQNITNEQSHTNLNNFEDEPVKKNETTSFSNDKSQNEPSDNSSNIEIENNNTIDIDSKNDIEDTNTKNILQTQPKKIYQTENTTTNTEPYKKLLINSTINTEESKNLNLKSKRGNFFYFIEKFFNVIRAKLNDVNTLAFVWVNYDSKTLEFGRLSTICPDTKSSLITEQQQIPFGNDLISEIVQKKSPIYPEIIIEMRDPTKELNYFSYYTQPVGTNSFICIPIYFRNNIIAVLCADSKKINAFKEDEYFFLEKITQPIAGLIYMFHNIIRQEKATQTIDLINEFNKLISYQGTTFKDICNTITGYIFNIYSATSIGIVWYNDKTKIGNILSYRTIEDIDKELFINENINLDTIIGESIVTNKTIRLAHIPNDYIRVNKYEPTINNGTFIAVPVYTTTDKYAIFIEFKNEPNILPTIDINMLETICEQAGKLLEKFGFMELLPTEIKTGIFTKTAFKKRLLEEFSKAIDNNSKVTLALISLNKYAAIDEHPNIKIEIFNKIIEIIKVNIKQYEIIGRINNNVLGVILFNKNINQSKIILEKIKQQLATNTIKINNKNFIFSVSIGAGNVNLKNTFEDFTYNVTKTLREAEKSNNCLQMFE